MPESGDPATYPRYHPQPCQPLLLPLGFLCELMAFKARKAVESGELMAWLEFPVLTDETLGTGSTASPSAS